VGHERTSSGWRLGSIRLERATRSGVCEGREATGSLIAPEGVPWQWPHDGPLGGSTSVPADGLP
jgi:hypothetical protein